MICIKLWIDNVRPAPEGYDWCKTVDDAKATILKMEQQQSECLNMAYQWLNNHEISNYYGCMRLANRREIELIDIDHDAGGYTQFGGDYIRLLDWLEETGRNYPIRIHSQNPVGVANMRRIIERNGWTEIK